jgi:hypothetical protein
MFYCSTQDVHWFDDMPLTFILFVSAGTWAAGLISVFFLFHERQKRYSSLWTNQVSSTHRSHLILRRLHSKVSAVRFEIKTLKKKSKKVGNRDAMSEKWPQDTKRTRVTDLCSSVLAFFASSSEAPVARGLLPHPHPPFQTRFPATRRLVLRD